MRREALQVPERVAALVAAGQAEGSGLHRALEAVAERLRARSDDALVTLARGSSDHAAQHFGYLVMARLGRLVTSLPPSLLTLHASPLPAARVTLLAWSQSGRSPDLVEPTARLRHGGAFTVACVNEPHSPLADAAECTLALQAGPERSVAATKSFVAQLVLGVQLVATWQRSAALQQALQRLPEQLLQATACDWHAGLAPLRQAQQLYVVGRGLGLALAQEMALKFKETCGIQAEAYSAAELRHGPLALVGAGWPVLVLALPGPAQAGLRALASELHARGAQVLLAEPEPGPGAASHATDRQRAGSGPLRLPLRATADEALDSAAVALSFYGFVEALSRARGRNPDQPPGLHKVTLTR